MYQPCEERREPEIHQYLMRTDENEIVSSGPEILYTGKNVDKQFGTRHQQLPSSNLQKESRKASEYAPLEDVKPAVHRGLNFGAHKQLKKMPVQRTSQAPQKRLKEFESERPQSSKKIGVTKSKSSQYRNEESNNIRLPSLWNIFFGRSD